MNTDARTLPGNPDIKFPPQEGTAMPYSKDGLIEKWLELPPDKNALITSVIGNLTAYDLPPNETVLLISVNGNLSAYPVPSGGPFVLGAQGGQLSWFPTKKCDK